MEDTPDSLIVNNDLSELDRVSAWVNAWLRRHDVPARTAERVDLCSAEAVINILQHAYAGGDPRERRISLRLGRQEDLLALEIEDDGMQFDPRQAETPPRATRLEDARIGGLGIQIIRGLSDELRHCRNDGRNRLTIIFRLPHHDRTDR